MNQTQIALKPIGIIRNQNNEFWLEIDEAYRPALQGLEGFSHLNVLWWCHLLDDELYREILVADQPYRLSPPKLGIFATRAPIRPNPIALTIIEVARLDLENGRIYTPYIDAEDSTPILDIKPYYPLDRVRHVYVPEWCQHWPQWYEDSAEFNWPAEFVNAR
jgi:tRNA-Thr(GGU) m(6)t(6)A37 methyltransferase TsaA